MSHQNGNPPVLIFADHPRCIDTDLRHYGIKQNVHQYPVSDQGRITQNIYRHIRDWRSGCVILDAQSFKGKEPASLGWCITMLASLRNNMGTPFRILIIRATRKNPADTALDRASGVDITFWMGQDALETHLPVISESIRNPQARNLSYATVWEYEPSTSDAATDKADPALPMESATSSSEATPPSPKAPAVKGRARFLRRQQRQRPEIQAAPSGAIFLILPADDDIGSGYTPPPSFTLRRFSCPTEEQLRSIVNKAPQGSMIAIRNNAIENFEETSLSHTGPGAALHRFTQFVQKTGGGHRVLILRVTDRRKGHNPAITQGDLEAGASEVYWHSLDQSPKDILDAIIAFAQTGSLAIKTRRVIPSGHTAVESLARMSHDADLLDGNEASPDDEADEGESPDDSSPETIMSPEEGVPEEISLELPEQPAPVPTEIPQAPPLETLKERLDRLQSDFLSLAIRFFEQLENLREIGEQFGECHKEMGLIAQALAEAIPASNSPQCQHCALEFTPKAPPEEVPADEVPNSIPSYEVASNGKDLTVRFSDGKEMRLTGKPAERFQIIAKQKAGTVPLEAICKENPYQAVQGIRLQLEKFRTGLSRCIIGERGHGYRFDPRIAHELLS